MNMPSASDPFALFESWFAEAEAQEPRDANAMILATADARGRPSARAVLLKAWDARGFVFYTNLDSRKGRELAANPQAALLFYWKSLSRQIRIEGETSLVDDAEADAYFATRPRESQLAAWASHQSEVMPEGRASFERALAEVTARFEGREVPRPPRWSGYRLAPDSFEFWREEPFRMHDRQVFARQADGGWEIRYLYP
ncbi:MAG: pyridoxamine 5'-phosphate oxidase [Alphaproteobacteria bacterium]|nr:MAG: pyridoxamine 5'-phosphate oxidase [Alphaproteobacteria bacterium]